MKVSASAVAFLALRSGVAAFPFVRRAAPVIDLGYAVYQGSHDSNSSINIFKGIRYAAPPVGSLRFAAPQPPVVNRTTQPATSDAPICPQTGASAKTPVEYGFVSAPGDEDCLFLNVFAPANATNLPVWFWIHGGGYGLFSASGLNPTEFMVTNGNNFISVIIQYRLGAFGFLPGDDVKSDGALNAGLLDMDFALQWVQQYIKNFGGDPTRVTIAGESAGAGAVVYQAMAYGGQRKVSLFNNIIAASPWIPHQYDYNDDVPTKVYDDFADAAGCSNASDTLQCLRETDTTVLQNASAKVSESGPFGTFAFLPVTDGEFIQERPSVQLLSKSLSGKRILSANLANEGVPLSPPTATTLEGFRDYIDITFPNFSDADKAALEAEYSYEGDDRDTDPTALRFETDGTSYPNAVNQSAIGIGQQQRIFNVFAEYAFDCPSYWLASAFPEAWKYQFSAPAGYHGFDLQALWSGTKVPGKSFKHAYRKIWGNFITKDSPIISIEDATAYAKNSTIPEGENGFIEWPAWSEENPVLLNLNTTGGVSRFHNVTDHLQYYTYADPGVVNNFKLANAYKWEGGRGERCDWWLDQAAKVPY